MSIGLRALLLIVSHVRCTCLVDMEVAFPKKPAPSSYTTVAQSLVGSARGSIPVALYSSPPNAGDRGPEKNYKKKVKRERRKQAGLSTNLLIHVLKQFEEEARTQSDMGDKELGQVTGCVHYQTYYVLKSSGRLAELKEVRFTYMHS